MVHKRFQLPPGQSIQLNRKREGWFSFRICPQLFIRRNAGQGNIWTSWGLWALQGSGCSQHLRTPIWRWALFHPPFTHSVCFSNLEKQKKKKKNTTKHNVCTHSAPTTLLTWNQQFGEAQRRKGMKLRNHTAIRVLLFKFLEQKLFVFFSSLCEICPPPKVRPGIWENLCCDVRDANGWFFVQGWVIKVVIKDNPRADVTRN